MAKTVKQHITLKLSPIERKELEMRAKEADCSVADVVYADLFESGPRAEITATELGELAVEVGGVVGLRKLVGLAEARRAGSSRDA